MSVDNCIRMMDIDMVVHSIARQNRLYNCLHMINDKKLFQQIQNEQDLKKYIQFFTNMKRAIQCKYLRYVLLSLVTKIKIPIHCGCLLYIFSKNHNKQNNICTNTFYALFFLYTCTKNHSIWSCTVTS